MELLLTSIIFGVIGIFEMVYLYNQGKKKEVIVYAFILSISLIISTLIFLKVKLPTIYEITVKYFNSEDNSSRK